ncbi:hypothetical protein ATDW_34780 (plasmid) [Asticcacaulis sp. DW145]|uniref:hypothetical protein n=1 Tax=Asticcacaulis sp. DW145 TaxID=3095608 RepID=UPI00308AC94F|nr:hypothetical protein ATDW_34780 [Asticcacaulis sp. DW145]
MARLLCLCLWLCLCLCLSAQAVAATLITAPDASPQAQTTAAWFQEEPVLGALRGQVVLAQRSQVAALLPPRVRAAWQDWSQTLPAVRSEAYALFSKDNWLIIAGDDDRGLMFGMGHVLRKAERGRVRGLPLYVAPDKAIRAHQIGYRFKNNSYDAFTLAMFERHLRDLIVFGTNGLQWIAPLSDDAAESPLFPAPPLDTLIGVSRLAQRYGVDFHLYYPQMMADYGDPAQRAVELKRFEALVRATPHVSSLFIPGGDPGHTPPDILFPLIRDEAAILRRYHPNATVWVSAQGFDKAQYERFYALMAEENPWLTGVFVGPQSRDTLSVQRARIPARYKVLFYPDIAHTLHAQFPVPGFDPAFALTEGREPINPQPQAQSYIYRHFAGDFESFVTYSEGVTDDVNKMLWAGLGMDRSQSASVLAADYGRYFLGDARFRAVPEGLERNWRGPVRRNGDIPRTLKTLRTLPHRDNWRYDMLAYRARYDAYVQRRAVAETQREDAAYQALSKNDFQAARRALFTPDDADTQALRTEIQTLAARLYSAIGLQLSVRLYGASNWERGANLDRLEVSLNDRVWLMRQMDQIEALPAPARAESLAALLRRDAPPPDGFYDDLGDPQASPHLVRGTDWADDPQRMAGALESIADRTPDDGWRLAWITYAEALYETPLELRYAGLDRTRPYRLKVVYAGEDYALPLTLIANDTTTLHAARARRSNPETVEMDLPPEVTAQGHLSLKWFRPQGLGGSGRGRQVAQVWLYPL